MPQRLPAARTAFFRMAVAVGLCARGVQRSGFESQHGIAALGCLLCFSFSAFSAPPSASVWELTPYQVQVLLVAGRSPQLTPEFNARLAADLLDRGKAVIGAPWDMTLADCPEAVRRGLLAGLESVDVQLLPEKSLACDKVMLLLVAPGESGYTVMARELDVRTQTWNAPIRAIAAQPGKLRDAAFAAICRAFAPLARISAVNTESKLVTLRLRAAGLPTRDAEFAAVAAGDLFLPVVRYNDREGNVSRINVVPWTFLTVDQAAEASLECRIHTGLRSPLTGRTRGRVERLAVGIVPPRAPTRLILRSRAESGRALCGYDVYNQAINSPETEFVGRTDREGSLMIAPGEPMLRQLLVKHGGILLARLPAVPGLQPELEAVVADDDQRLEAEGYLSGLQDELVDLVTRRQLLLIRAQARLAAGKLDEADELLREIRLLKTRDEFHRELAQEQQRVFADDPAVQRQIDAMFATTQKLLAQYLDPKPVDDLTDELAKARAEAGTGA